MKKASVIGHFGFGENLLNGQTIKTKIVTEELEKQLGKDNVKKVDTHGGVKAYLKLPFQILSALRECENIIIFPAHNGIKIIAPLLRFENRYFNRKLHYVVIGGWLPEFITSRTILKKCLVDFDGIYVETNGMKMALEDQGINNIIVLPNFKNIVPLQKENLVYRIEPPIRVCTFSRVMKEKGIEDAIDAVEEYNQKMGNSAIELDIYGQIDPAYKDEFSKVTERMPAYIKYKGMVPSSQSVDTIKHYQALLFPTHYDGEGFAGTLIDAMAAGVPVIASDWRYNAEIVRHGKTGIIYRESLFDALCKMMMDINEWNAMKPLCIDEAHKYMSYNAIQELIKHLD